MCAGSSFPKAKPKHGLSTVACLAFQRLLLLPLYRDWWIQQTSDRIFMLFLLLYSLQVANVFLYYVNASRENDAEVREIFDVLPRLSALLRVSIVIVIA